MKKLRFRGLPIIFFGIVWLGTMGLVIVCLWNLLIPTVLGLPAIGFWQALGLLLLSRVLFGRVGGWSPNMRKARWVRGWNDLTPDERQRFRRAMEPRRPGNFGDGEAAEEV